MMKKIVNICAFVICIFQFVGASVLEKPRWGKGDYWEYAMWTAGMENETVIKGIILGVENVTINNTTYRCIVERENWFYQEKLIYYDEESLAIIKEVVYDNETNKTEEKIYDPPFNFIQYPIFIGKRWNITIEQENKSAIIQMECNGKKYISTRAGKFDCYVVKEIINPPYFLNQSIDVYLFFYISDVVGNIVKSESYINTTLTSYTELLSFSYAASPKKHNYLLIILLIGATLFILLLVLYKLRKSEGKNMEK